MNALIKAILIVLFLVIAVNAFMACNIGVPVDSSKYDKSCNEDADCAFVAEHPCECPNVAINVDEVERFSAERDANWDLCTSDVDCLYADAFCADGGCEFRQLSEEAWTKKYGLSASVHGE